MGMVRKRFGITGAAGSWVAPRGVRLVLLRGMGGGGGGGGGGGRLAASAHGGGGGGGGGGAKMFEQWVDVVPGTSYTITIGAGGNGGAGGAEGNTGGDGVFGGTTSFGTLATFGGAMGGTYGEAGWSSGGAAWILGGLPSRAQYNSNDYRGAIPITAPNISLVDAFSVAYHEPIGRMAGQGGHGVIWRGSSGLNLANTNTWGAGTPQAPFNNNPGGQTNLASGGGGGGGGGQSEYPATTGSGRNGGAGGVVGGTVAGTAGLGHAAGPYASNFQFFGCGGGGGGGGAGAAGGIGAQGGRGADGYLEVIYWMD
jgi:hypothetical protein